MKKAFKIAALVLGVLILVGAAFIGGSYVGSHYQPGEGLAEEEMNWENFKTFFVAEVVPKISDTITTVAMILAFVIVPLAKANSQYQTATKQLATSSNYLNESEKTNKDISKNYAALEKRLEASEKKTSAEITAMKEAQDQILKNQEASLKIQAIAFEAIPELVKNGQGKSIAETLENLGVGTRKEEAAQLQANIEKEAQTKEKEGQGAK